MIVNMCAMKYWTVIDVRTFWITSNRAAREFVHKFVNSTWIRGFSDYNCTKISAIKLINDILVIGPSILVYILVEDQQMRQMTTLLWCPVKWSYMFRRTNAIIRELIWSLQATYMSVCITRRIMEFRTISLQSVLLHYGNEWLWLTAAGSS
jgi:hypothetical protein